MSYRRVRAEIHVMLTLLLNRQAVEGVYGQ